MTGWVLCAPMRVEARALRRGTPAGTPVRRTGRGMAASRVAGGRHITAHAWAVAGIGGGLSAALRPGDVVVATEVRDEYRGAVLTCPAAPLVAGALCRGGLTVHLGPVVSGERVAAGARRDRLAATGALAADTETAALLAYAGERAVACVRVVADVPPYPLYRPATLRRVRTALRALPLLGPALVEWAQATTVRRLVLAPPDFFGTGAERLADRVDVVLVLAPAEYVERRRLVATAGRGGAPVHLVDDVGAVDLRWLAGARTVGLATDASVPPRLVEHAVAVLAGLGARTVREHHPSAKNVRSILPKEPRSA